MHYLLPACAVFLVSQSCATQPSSEPETTSTITVVAIDWTKLEQEPLRKLKRMVDVRAVSDPALASTIIHAAEPVLRFLGSVMYAATEDASEPEIRARVEGPTTGIRMPPKGTERWRPKYIHSRIYDWKLAGPDQIEFTVLYKEISGKQHYTDDYRFVQVNGTWLFRGHVSAQPTLIQTTPLKYYAPYFP